VLYGTYLSNPNIPKFPFSLHSKLSTNILVSSMGSNVCRTVSRMPVRNHYPFITDYHPTTGHMSLTGENNSVVVGWANLYPVE